MANEKILNTRILLKYDSFSNWTKNNPVLRAGEVAIAYLASSNTTTTPDNGTHPVMFKVGPGAFNALPWASALAADVHAWAKQASLPIERDPSETGIAGNVISNITWDAENGKIIYNTATVATSESMAQLTEKIAEIEKDYLKAADIANMATDAEVEAAIETETNRAQAAEEALGKRIDAIDFISEEELNGALAPYAKIADVVANDAFNTFKSENTQAIAAAKSGAEKTASDALAAARTEITAEIDADVKVVNDKFANYTNTEALTALLAGKQDNIPDNTYDSYGAAATAEQNAKDYADDIKDAILGEGIKDTFDTLVEIQTWIEGAGVNATELTEAIAAEAKTREESDALKADKTALEAAENRIKSLEEKPFDTYATKTEVQNVDKKFESYTNTEALTALLANKQDIIPAETYDTYGAAATAKSEAIAAAATDATTKANEAQAAAEGKVTELANGAVAANTDAINTINQTIAGYGDIVSHNVSEFATATQGGKADSALQEITTTANNGLKITNKNQIDIDDSVVFVFNCGNSSTLIDA